MKDKGPLRIYSSPLTRTRETADELAKLWGVTVQIEDRVAEVPSGDRDLASRSAWLAEVMRGSWRTLSPDLMHWRNNMIEFVEKCPGDSVVFAHYVAINILVGSAEGNDHMVVFRPENASITEFDNTDGRLSVVSKGIEATTKIN